MFQKNLKMCQFKILVVTIVIFCISATAKADTDPSTIYYVLSAEISILRHELASTKAELKSVKTELENLKMDHCATDVTVGPSTGCTPIIKPLKDAICDLRRDMETLIETKDKAVNERVSYNTEKFLTLDKNLTTLVKNLEVSQEELDARIDGHLSSYKQEISTAIEQAEHCQAGHWIKNHFPYIKLFPSSAIVKFKRPFRKTPVLTFGTSFLDFLHEKNVRLDMSVTQVTRTQFKVFINPWHDTVAYGVGFHWMACPR